MSLNKIPRNTGTPSVNSRPKTIEIEDENDKDSPRRKTRHEKHEYIKQRAYVPLNYNIILAPKQTQDVSNVETNEVEAIFTDDVSNVETSEIVRAHNIWKLRQIICRSRSETGNTGILHLPSLGFLFDLDIQKQGLVVDTDKPCINSNSLIDENSVSEDTINTISTTARVLTHFYLNSQANMSGDTWFQEDWNFLAKENSNLDFLKQKDGVLLHDLKVVQPDHSMVLNTALRLINCKPCMKNLFFEVYQDIIRANMGFCYFSLLESYKHSMSDNDKNDVINECTIEYIENVLLDVLGNCFVWWYLIYPDFCKDKNKNCEQTQIPKILKGIFNSKTTSADTLESDCQSFDTRQINVEHFNIALYQTLIRWSKERASLVFEALKQTTIQDKLKKNIVQKVSNLKPEQIKNIQGCTNLCRLVKGRMIQHCS